MHILWIIQIWSNLGFPFFFGIERDVWDWFLWKLTGWVGSLFNSFFLVQDLHFVSYKILWSFLCLLLFLFEIRIRNMQLCSSNVYFSITAQTPPNLRQLPLSWGKCKQSSQSVSPWYISHSVLWLSILYGLAFQGGDQHLHILPSAAVKSCHLPEA